MKFSTCSFFFLKLERVVFDNGGNTTGPPVASSIEAVRGELHRRPHGRVLHGDVLAGRARVVPPTPLGQKCEHVQMCEHGPTHNSKNVCRIRQSPKSVCSEQERFTKRFVSQLKEVFQSTKLAKTMYFEWERCVTTQKT